MRTPRRLLGYAVNGGDAVLKPRLLNAGIRLDYVHFLPQRGNRRAFDREAVNFPNGAGDARDLPGVSLDGGGPDHLQRIIQEVRVDLAAQGVQLRVFAKSLGFIQRAGLLENILGQCVERQEQVKKILAQGSDFGATVQLQRLFELSEAVFPHVGSGAAELVERRYHAVVKHLSS